MADTLAEFYSRLGALADPAGASSSTETSTDAALVLSKIASQYVALSLQAEYLRQIMAGGTQIPCDVWSAYVAARQDYLAKSQAVFDQLGRKGVAAQQVLYSGGKPQLDPADATKYATIVVPAPLRPPAFVGITQQCPAVPSMSGAAVGTFGWERTPVFQGAIDASTVLDLGDVTSLLVLTNSTGIPLGLAGVNTYKTIKPVAVLWTDFDGTSSRALAAYTTCFRGVLQQPGATAADASKRCAVAQSTAASPAAAAGSVGSKLGFWGWLGVIFGVALVGSVALRALRRPAAPAIAGVPAPRSRYSAPSDPIFLGDLFLHPRGRK
jgi:hypothetical protein